MKIKINWIAVIGWFILLFIFAVWVTSCNPVKQVLNNKAKFDEVAREVVKAGYCANDTTIIVKSDTLVQVDTMTIIDEKPFLEIINDTVYVTKWKTNNITKSVTIHDTIKSVVVDNARVKILREDLLVAQEEALDWKKRANKLFGYFMLLLFGVGVYTFIKLRK